MPNAWATKYKQEITPIDGIYVTAKFNGLSELISLELKSKPINTKVLIADIKFINKSLEINNNVTENKVKKMILSKLNKIPGAIDDLKLFINANKNLMQRLKTYCAEFEETVMNDISIKSNRGFRKINLTCEESIEDSKVLEEYQLAQAELLKKIASSNKGLLIKMAKDVENMNTKEVVLKVILAKICTDPFGSLILLKVFSD